MADKLGLGPEVRQLKIGQSFTNPRSSSFHSIRYDFKPASVDINKMATVDVGNNNQVTVTVPHLDGAGVPQTLFKGSQKPYQKECVLIIDRVTGEITLEKLSSNVQVKKTRAEAYKPPSGLTGASSNSSSNRPSTPVEQPGPLITQRSSSKTRVTSGSRRNPTHSVVGLIPKHSPLHASPSHHPSPSHHAPLGSNSNSHGPNLLGPPSRSTNSDRHMEAIGLTGGQSTLASLPMIGLDDIGDIPEQTPPTIHINNHSNNRSPAVHSEEEQNGVGILSDSSSSSSSESGSSDSESDEPSSRTKNGGLRPPPATNGKIPTPNITAPSHLLNEDLCLSESATDSD